jgi:hypothetical protein
MTTDSANIKRGQTNEKQSQRFKKTKEVQRHPQANAQLRHSCFCTNNTTIMNRK